MPQDPSVGDPLMIQVGPSFSAPDAARLHDTLARAAPDAAVEIDFRDVREWEAAALAVLARDLVERRPHVAVHGLSQRQLRLLNYLGVDAKG